jgi:hypothetical protein
MLIEMVGWGLQRRLKLFRFEKNCAEGATYSRDLELPILNVRFTSRKVRNFDITFVRDIISSLQCRPLPSRVQVLR